MPWAPEGYTEAISIGDLLLRTAERHPDRDALVFPDRRVSYAELAAQARRIARGLIGAGLEPGQKVGYLMANSVETVATFYAIALAGGVIVPINTRYRARELPFVIANAELSMIVTSDRIDDYVDLPALLGEALPLVESPPTIVALGEREAPGTLTQAEFDTFAAATADHALDERRLRVKVGGLAVLLFTSGTTSQPRACMLSHEALVRNWTTFGNVFRMQPGEKCWAPGPMFHLGAIGPILMNCAMGAAMLTDVWYDPTRALELLGREQPEILYPAYPPITMGVLAHPRFAEIDLTPARAILNVGPPDLLRQIQNTLPHATLVTIYALSESGGAVTLTSLDDDLETRVSTCGSPIPGVEVKVTDGEILVRGVSVCDGYYRDPEKNAQAFDADGWLHTGDRGSLDEDGRVKFLGRLKEMLKVGGENVAAVEIESHISTHPAVKLVQVVGVPDERLWEIPVAAVELRPGMSATEQEIIAHCRDAIASFKVPRHVRFVTEWPMSASKIQKHRLRAALLDELGLQDEVTA
jgi:acyl-CoA synthetase (AMP-forming)/AMP-acid ligase II